MEGALLPQGQRETHNLLIWKNKRKAAKKPLLSLENSGFYGKALQSRYFKFSICHLDILLNGLLGRAAFAAFERFATGKTSADCARRRVSERNRREAAALGAEMDGFAALSIKIPKGAAAFGRRNPKRKDILSDVLSFWWTIQDSNL